MEPDFRAAGRRSTEQRSDTENFVARSCAEQPEAWKSGGEHDRNQRLMDGMTTATVIRGAAQEFCEDARLDLSILSNCYPSSKLGVRQNKHLANTNR